MFAHLYMCDSILVFKFIPVEYKHNTVTEKRDSPIYEDKAHKRRAVEAERFQRKSDQVETKGGRGQMFNYHAAAVAKVNYKS